MEDPKVYDVIQLLGKKFSECNSLSQVTEACYENDSIKRNNGGENAEKSNENGSRNKSSRNGDSDGVSSRSGESDSSNGRSRSGDGLENDVCLRVAVKHEAEKWRELIQRKNLV